MCRFVEHPADTYFGRILSLQDHRDGAKRLEHIIDELFGTSFDPESEQGRLSLNLTKAFRSRAHTAVVENYYFDLDFRSELGRLQEDTFLPMPADVSRIHFFADRSRGSKVRLRDFVAEAREYLGYVVVRPLQVGTFGRSIVTTKTSIADDHVSAKVAEHRIKTTVREPVQLFGVDLEAIGVPFMEQDGRLLRCAHVSAWICHYSAVLRGDVTRRPSGHFHSSDLAIESVGRPFPSQGLSAPMLSALLRTMDLPPEVIDETELLRGRRKKTGRYIWNWSDGPVIQKQVADASELENPQPALDRIWIRHNLTTTVARYVNSSIPVILARLTDEHTQVIVGYLRSSDYPGGTPAADLLPANNPIVAFIVSDDSAGPFEIVLVETIVEQVISSVKGIYLVVPLPRSLWMGGKTAELLGINWLEYYVEDRLTEWLGDKTALADFAELLHQGLLAVRTYMTTGTDFKRSIAKRMTDAETIRGATQIQLPRYVWVVEVFKRKDDAPLAEALAMIVFDPTGPVNRDNGAAVDEASPPLFAYLPGMTYADYDAIGDLWFETSVEKFRSGRGGHEQTDDHSENEPSKSRSREIWKSAVAGGSSR